MKLRKGADPSEYETRRCIVCKKEYLAKKKGKAQVCGSLRCCTMRKAMAGEKPFDPGSAAARTPNKHHADFDYHGKYDI